MVVQVRLNEGDVVDENAAGGKYGYRIGHTLGNYSVPDRVLNSVDDRPVKVITIGAGVSGILMAHLLQRNSKNVKHVIYEKNGDVRVCKLLSCDKVLTTLTLDWRDLAGGMTPANATGRNYPLLLTVRFQNRYPGCACDVPSHAYTFAFALNADWPAYLSNSEDIFRYLTRVVECFDLRRYMRFNSPVQSCEWLEKEGKWRVTIKDAKSGAVFHDECDILVGANGLLNSWKWPEEVKGLHEFSGKLVHTARWPDEYTADQWKNERVAVLGSGASAIQVVPTMQTEVKHMNVYLRSPVWFAELGGHGGENSECKYRPYTHHYERLICDPEMTRKPAKSCASTMPSCCPQRNGLKMGSTRRWALRP